VDLGHKQGSVLMENKFEFLFEDAKRRQNQHEEFKNIVPDSECTFQPNIYMSQKNHQSINQTSDRNLYAKSVSRVRPITAHPENSEKIDKQTGQALFKPKVGRPPRVDRNIGALPVGDYLYAQSKRMREMQNKKQAEIEKEKSKSLCSVSLIQEESRQMVEGRKEAIFSEIFNILDKDGDNIISAKTVNISGIFFVKKIKELPTEVLELYTPLFCEMEELDQELNLEEFVEASGRLYDSLSIPEKNSLLTYKKRTKKSSGTEHNYQVFFC